MDLTRMRSLSTCRGCKEALLCCREELCVEEEDEGDVSVCESPPRAQTISLSYQFHIPSFSLSIYTFIVYVYKFLEERDYAGVFKLCVFVFVSRRIQVEVR